MKKSPNPNALDTLEEALKERQKDAKKKKCHYRIPSLWVSAQGSGRSLAVDPYEFYLGVIRKVKKLHERPYGEGAGGEWTRGSVIYNMFVRTTTAFDHDGNGQLDLPVNAEGFRETGTFLKAIAMLPYIKRLGATTVHLLPVTSIGHDGNKGSLGSPYAIRNPYNIDENLSEPSLRLDAKTEFKAFVEAAHNMGLRVVVEFVFRTAAKDSDWVKEHPEWMYWIKESVQVRDPQNQDESRYGSPLFTPDELRRIHQDVLESRMDNLIAPHQVYRGFFTASPASEGVHKENGRFIGLLPDGTRVKIPGAFADWPPDDNQPPWGDVTYLKMYTHPDFNYIGYNTIRMYDKRLTEEQHVNRPLWDRIVGIIPYYQHEFGIDGVMIDMGHALPKELKEEIVGAARMNNPDFAFWDENFAITEKSRAEGYNAVFGYLWVDEHHREKMRSFIARLANEAFPLSYFGTPENHNTPRAASRSGGTAYSRWALVVNSFIPAVPFIHSGYELAERYPINTGLDFTHDQIRQLPSEKLPLFSEYAYNWLSKEEFTPFVKKVLAVRAKHLSLITNPDPAGFQVLAADKEPVLAFARLSEKPKRRLAVITNSDFSAAIDSVVDLGASARPSDDLLSGKKLKCVDGRIHVQLAPGECIVCEYERERQPPCANFRESKPTASLC